MNDENVENLNFITFVNQILTLVKWKKMIKSVCKTKFKNDQTMTLMKKNEKQKKMKKRKLTN